MNRYKRKGEGKEKCKLFRKITCSTMRTLQLCSTAYTPNGYIVPAKFGILFLPLTKTVPKRTKLHLNEIGFN